MWTCLHLQPIGLMQALEKQDEHIEELEATAQEMQQELANANKSIGQQASSMDKVRQYSV